MALNDDMSAVFKSSRTDLDTVPDNNTGVDPVSGNPVPLGSSPEEVRDDIPAQLSEGEYVVPADVVRYYGVKFFEDLRADAKFGYQDMEENGRIGGDPVGMEMVEPEDDMMFDISELEVTEGPDEPEGAFLGKLFGGGKKEPSPEERVRERFKEVEKREKQKRTVIKNKDGTTRTVFSGGSRVTPRDQDGGGSRARIDLGFGGNPMERAERKYGPKKDKPKSEGAGSVQGAYTPNNDEPTFAEMINFGGNYNEGGAVDDDGRLGLGSEGIGLSGSGSGTFEVREYRNDAGHVMMIMFLDGEPLSAIPEGYYPVGDAPEAVITPEEEVVSGGDDSPEVPVAEAINYQALTKKEMVEMLEEQQSMKGDVISAGLGMINPLMGGLMKLAMWDSSRRLEAEIERRAKDPSMSEADRTDYEMMLEMAKTDKPSLIERIFGGKDTKKPLEEQTYTPETVAVDERSVNDAVAEAIKYDPTARTVLEDSTIEVTELPDPVKPNNKAGEMPEVYRPKVEGPNVTAMRKTYLGDENTRPDVDFADPTMVPPAAPEPSETENMRYRRAGERAGETVTNKTKARMIRRESEKRGKSIAEIGRAIAPSDEERNVDYNDPRRGMKKGGLASKKKKKK